MKYRDVKKRVCEILSTELIVLGGTDLIEEFDEDNGDRERAERALEDIAGEMKRRGDGSCGR